MRVCHASYWGRPPFRSSFSRVLPPNGWITIHVKYGYGHICILRYENLMHFAPVEATNRGRNGYDSVFTSAAMRPELSALVSCRSSALTFALQMVPGDTCRSDTIRNPLTTNNPARTVSRFLYISRLGMAKPSVSSN